MRSSNSWFSRDKAEVSDLSPVNHAPKKKLKKRALQPVCVFQHAFLFSENQSCDNRTRAIELFTHLVVPLLTTSLCESEGGPLKVAAVMGFGGERKTEVAKT